MRADYPVRKSPRLKKYNYSEKGAYFVTFCTKERSCTLGSIAVGARPWAPTAALPRFVGTVKRLVNREVGENIWQRSFHEHIVRNEKDYLDIWTYIVNNPARWAEDRYFSL